jgi:hypothetical protein
MKCTQAFLIVVILGFFSCRSKTNADQLSHKDAFDTIASTSDRAWAKDIISKALAYSTSKNVYFTNFVKDANTAVGVAEPILFGLYGKDHILNERPYHCYFANEHWLITGSLKQGWLGGTFLIIINAKTGRVIKLTHGK